jgi:hypothetical protein
VSSGEFEDKPVALLNASRASTHAQASLTETLNIMMAKVNTAASVRVPLPSNKIDEVGMVANPEICQALSTAIRALARSASDKQIS